MFIWPIRKYESINCACYGITNMTDPQLLSKLIILVQINLINSKPRLKSNFILWACDWLVVAALSNTLRTLRWNLDSAVKNLANSNICHKQEKGQHIHAGWLPCSFSDNDLYHKTYYTPTNTFRVTIRKLVMILDIRVILQIIK